MTRTYTKEKKIALISAPWPLYNRPSIQLGTLKAYLQSTDPHIRVEAHHFYLELAASLGYKLYQEISERTWLAECIYAALLFPERFETIDTLFTRNVRSKPLLKKTGLKKIAAQAKKISDAFINSRRWEDHLMAGFSVSLCQFTSTLYFIKRLKRRFPDLCMVIGGSSFSGTAPKALFELLPELDVVINGEGEQPLGQLVGFLKEGSNLGDLPPIKGVIRPKSVDENEDRDTPNQLNRLNKLPPPDYGDYFALLNSLKAEKIFFPVLPIETSRGCWWQRSSPAGKSSGCAFCNLNLQWEGYRTKDPGQVAGEIDHLTTKYQTLAVSIVDNVLPRRASKEIFQKLIGLNKDLRMFSEIRASTTRSELNLMAQAGMQEVQIGIEALSTSLLTKLHKGTTAIQNLEIMRDCEALGLANYANLILHFPGSDEQDVAETLRSLEFAQPYRPLKAVGFWLGLGSPVWQNPEAYGINSVFNHPNWGCLFPKKFLGSMQLMIQAYRGDLGYQRKIWRPVEHTIKKWQQAYTEQICGPERSAPLNMRDGREFLIIRQRKFDAETINHRLVGTSRLIYLYCQHHRSIKRIRDRFPAFSEDKILSFLKMMVTKRLMYEEKERYLSLAVPVKHSEI